MKEHTGAQQHGHQFVLGRVSTTFLHTKHRIKQMSTTGLAPHVLRAPTLALDAYFERIGYAGSTSRSLETLNAIVQAHVQSIPFENIDVLSGRGIDLDPAVIWKKLVASPRGGYCFEQNALLADVLQQLGFSPRVLSARVLIGRASDFVPARTHMVLRVDLDQRSWLVDCGVGGLSPTASLDLGSESEQPTPHEARRIVRVGQWQGLGQRAPDAKLLHQVRLGESWHDVCELTLEEMPAIDRTLANWYLNTHPESHFRDRLMVAKANPDGRVTLLNKEFTRRDLAGVSTTRSIETAEQLGVLLRQEFGIVTSDVETLWSKVP